MNGEIMSSEQFVDIVNKLYSARKIRIEAQKMALDIIRSKTDPAGLIPMDVSMPAEHCLQNMLIEVQIASQCKSADVIYQLKTLFSVHLFEREAAMVLLDKFKTIFLFFCRDARLSKFEILLDMINKMADGMT